MITSGCSSYETAFPPRSKAYYSTLLSPHESAPIMYVLFLENAVIRVSASALALSCFSVCKIIRGAPEVFQRIGRKLLFFLQRGRKCETLQGVSTGSELRHKLLKCFHHSRDKQDFTAFCGESCRLGLKMAFCREIPVKAAIKGNNGGA